MRICVGSDHAGFPLKAVVHKFLAELGHEMEDLGTHSTYPVDYPDYHEAVMNSILDGRNDRGVLICGTGARAGLCHDTYSAHQGVEHDHMNVLVLGGRVIGEEMARELVRAFVNAKCGSEERHVRRLGKVAAIEKQYSQPSQLAGKSRGL